MEILCENCHAAIHVPDGRVPPNSTFRLPCPRCKQKIVATTKVPEADADPRFEEVLSPMPSETSCTFATDPEEDPSLSVRCTQSDQMVVLLYINKHDVCQELCAALGALGYVVDVPETVAQALQRLRLNQYAVVILDDAVEANSLAPVVESLAGLNMSRRRDTFIVLLGNRFSTGDHLQAFSESVDLVLHSNHTAQFTELLRRGLEDHERLYQVFTACLTEAGRKN